MLNDISVVILTLNEETNIQACLAAIDWAKDRVVIDSGSTDRTLEIVEAHQTRYLVHKKQPFLISEQRNWALDNARLTTEWTLFIDADEIVTDKLREELITTTTNAPGNVVAYKLTPKFIFLGKWLRHCQGYPNWHDRLIRTSRVRYSGGVWEHFVTEGKIDFIREPYLHYSVSKGITSWFEKHLRYATAEAEDILATRGENITTFPGINKTLRKRKSRNMAARFWPLRPIVRFTLMYLVRRGFLDGLPGLLYCLMIMCYEFIIILKVIELKRYAAQQSI